MIPARLGSKRVKKKNLRLLAGRPLITYAIKNAIDASVFDEIYLNSEDQIFENFAQQFGIKFYHRNKIYATDDSNNDQFLGDFIDNIEADVIIQLLPTSPFIEAHQIKHFTNALVSNKKTETLVSVINHKIASIFNNKPINFSQTEYHISSQLMDPIQTYATVLMGWRVKSLKESLKKNGYGYHGIVGKTSYFVLEGLAKVDIDYEEDFQLAEFIMKYKNSGSKITPQYYDELNGEHSEVDVPSILSNDGIFQADFENENLSVNDLNKLIDEMNNEISWCRRIINTESNSATLISQLPGEGNRLHYHPDWNEWWYIVRGQWEWEIDGKKVLVNEGEVVFIPKNTWHKITAIGDKPAVRLAVSREDVAHIYKS